MYLYGFDSLISMYSLKRCSRSSSSSWKSFSHRLNEKLDSSPPSVILCR